MILRLTENELINVIRKVLSEQMDTLGVSDKQGFGEKPSSGIFNYSGVEFFACQKSPCKFCAKYKDEVTKYKISVTSLPYTGEICLKKTYKDDETNKFMIIDNTEKEFELSPSSLMEVAKKVKENSKQIVAKQSLVTVTLNKVA
jgi:hypothetical protein